MVKSSISKIILGGMLGSLTAMVPVARAAEPEAAAITVDPAPGVDLPPEIAADVRAAIEDALAGRAPPAAPIDVTVEAGGVVVRVGSLWRRIAIARWDYAAARTVALHVLDLLQPAPEVPEVATASPAADPTATTLVKEARASERATDFAGPWSLQAGVAGARGVHGPEPWMVAAAVGVAWSRNWLRIGLEAGWDHAFVRHPDGSVRGVNYDAVPLRLVLAAQNSVVMAGVRAGAAWYRVTGQQTYREVTPLVGPFLAARVPIAGSVRGLLVGGFDYFGRHTELIMYTPTPAYSTPEVAPYLGVVVETVLRP